MPNPKPFEPMLAATLKTADKAVFPLLLSAKFDGIRVIIIDGVVMSRYLKPIPNAYVQKLFGKKSLNGLDGELIVGEPTAPDCFRKTNSGVTSRDGEPDVWLYFFDDITHPDRSFIHRHTEARTKARLHPRCRPVAHHQVNTVDELTTLQEEALNDGYEGVMLRRATAPYKYGRGTLTAQDLMKLKLFSDAEAEIIGAEEEMANNNAATKDALGKTARSSHKAGKTGKGRLGALIVKGVNGPYKGVTFNIGAGFTAKEREELWALWLAGKLTKQRCKYKFFPSGSKDKPRFPVWLGFRAKGT
jgi:DNA ligase-1